MFQKFILRIVISIFLSGSPALTISAPLHNKTALGSYKKTPFALKGNIYILEPNTNKLPDFTHLKSIGQIYATNLNITPRSFDEGFPGVTGHYEWFAIDYKGTFPINEPGEYKFRLTSDDGSILFIDGKKVIDNDGIHSPATKQGSIDLKKGIHNIRIQYFQGPAFEIALVLEIQKQGQHYEIFNPSEMVHALNNNWLEELMDTTTLIATFALLAFMVERLTNGIAVVLGYWAWWRRRMEAPLSADADTKSRVDRNRRVFLFVLTTLLAVTGSVFMGLNLLAQLGVDLPSLAGETITGLLIASGADPIRELSHFRRQQEPNTSSTPTPVQVTGTLIVHNSQPGDGSIDHSRESV